MSVFYHICRKILPVAALIVLMASAACSAVKDDGAFIETGAIGEAVPLRVSVLPEGTPALTKSELQTSDEKNVDNLIVFVYLRSTGALVWSFGSSSDSAQTELPAGEYTLWAFANYIAEPSGLATVSQAATYHSGFIENSRGRLFMRGSKDVTISSGIPADEVIPVVRDVAKVELTAIPTFTGFVAGAVFKEAVLVNVPKMYLEEFSSSNNADFWNPDGESIELPGMLRITSTGCVYGFPNHSLEESSSTLRDYVTKFSICASLNGRDYWYPIGLPDISSNQVYTIPALEISGYGSDDPNEYVIDLSTKLNTGVSVRAWENGADYTQNI